MLSYFSFNKKLKITLVAISCILLIFKSVSTAQEKLEMDVLLIMDSSGSMKKTDPQTLRIPAAKMFTSLLDKDDRVGVVSFSDKGYALSLLTSLNRKKGRDKLFKALDKISSNGFYTNLHDAFQKGLKVLMYDRKKGRRKIAILMSDGEMDVGSPDKDKKLTEQLKSKLLKEFKEKAIKVYTIAFTKNADIRLLREVSKATGGKSYAALSERDFPIIFTDIFESLKSPEMLPLDNNMFLVDDSIREVTIVVSKDSLNTNVLLEAPNGKKLSSMKKDNARWFVSQDFDMITLKNPDPGRWKIQFSTGKGNKAYIVTNITMMTNFKNTRIFSGEPADINVWFEKDEKVIEMDEILNHVDIFFEVVTPDGKSLSSSFLSREDIDKAGIFNGQLLLKKPGDYKLRIVAKGITFNRQKTLHVHVAETKPGEGDKTAKDDKTKVEHVTDKAGSVSIKKVITRFVVINIILFSLVAIYVTRGKIKALVSFSKRRS